VDDVALLAPASALLAGATVQKIDIAADLAVLRLRTPGATFFLVIASGRSGPLVGITRSKPFKGTGVFSKEGTALPLGEKIRVRTRIEGAKIVGITEQRALFVREEEAPVVIEGSPASAARVVMREARAGDDRGDASARADDIELWCARGEELVRGFGEGAFEARQVALSRSLTRAMVKIERRIKVIRADLDRQIDADRLAEQAASFVAAAARAPRGARSLTVTDWSSGEAKSIELALDPAKTAREQLDAMFKRAKRLKLGGAIAKRRLGEAETAWEALAELGEQAKIAESYEAIDALAAAARKAAPREFALGAGTSGATQKREGGKAAPSRPYRVFRGESGAKILSGKGAAGNDALTLHVARPHDLWLHAKGRTGAHVIVTLEKNSVCPSDVLVEAAHVAAHFSEGREEGVIEIQYTPRRYLRKPRGAAPGMVIVEREKVLVLRVDPAMITRLLAGEELG
jgi:fibronectin-binding protein A (FbpA)/ribosomal quality control pathway NFACT family protein